MPAAANVGRFSGDESAVDGPIPPRTAAATMGPPGSWDMTISAPCATPTAPFAEDLGEPCTARLRRGELSLVTETTSLRGAA